MINKKLDEIAKILNEVKNIFENDDYFTNLEKLLEIIQEQNRTIQIEKMKLQIDKDCLQQKIDKVIEYFEIHKQECVVGRNKDDKLIKDYYLPAHLTPNIIEILKGDSNE